MKFFNLPIKSIGKTRTTKEINAYHVVLFKNINIFPGLHKSQRFTYCSSKGENVL